MDGISVRDLLNRGIGFMAGMNAVLKVIAESHNTQFVSAYESENMRKLLHAYVQSVIAAHRKA